MKVVHSYPPNIEDIKKEFGESVLAFGVVFTYGDTIYNPSKIEIQNHLLVHEQVHQIQQEAMGIELWWQKYLSDKEFRLSQELEAYATQYKFVRSKFPSKISKWLLERISHDLSSAMYGNLLTASQAETKIRLWTK